MLDVLAPTIKLLTPPKANKPGSDARVGNAVHHVVINTTTVESTTIAPQSPQKWSCHDYTCAKK
jgi:hypothetical protein